MVLKMLRKEKNRFVLVCERITTALVSGLESISNIKNELSAGCQPASDLRDAAQRKTTHKSR